MNTQNDAVNVLHTIRAPEKGRIVKPIIIVAIIMLIIGGLYYAYFDQSDAPAHYAIEQASSPKPLVRPAAQLGATQITPKTRQQQAQTNVRLESSINAMRARQTQRDTQIQAYLQSARVPERVPDLPVIAPLEVSQNALNPGQTQKQFDVNSKHTLPPSVMDKFTAETGLTQAEIEQAMNQ